MKFLKLRRAIKEGWTSFKRNTWLTVATIVVLSLSLFVLGSTFFMGMSANELISNIEKNVNISVYFKNNVSEDRIQEIKREVESKVEVLSVEYISKDVAIEKFTKDNEDDATITTALDEIGENPLFSSLILTARDQKDYSQIDQYMKNSYPNEIDRVNYGKNKNIIDRLAKIVGAMQKIGLTIGAVFILISFLVTFSAIRMSLYARKKEFDIKRLVGASNLYIKIPSIFEGIFYGLFASFIAMILIAITAYGSIPIIAGVIPKEEMFKFYLSSSWQVGGLVLAAGLLIGIISSMISIRKYLKI